MLHKALRDGPYDLSSGGNMGVPGSVAAEPSSSGNLPNPLSFSSMLMRSPPPPVGPSWVEHRPSFNHYHDLPHLGLPGVKGFYSPRGNDGVSSFWEPPAGVLPDATKGSSAPAEDLPADSPSGHPDGPSVVINSADLDSWVSHLHKRAVIGLCNGVRPPVDVLRQWISQQWEARNILVDQVQYLPNNYYIFFMANEQHAFQVISKGQWLIRNTPLSVFKWYKGFDPKGKKPSRAPVWVDFPDLPIELYPWLKEIGGNLGKVLGQKPKTPINPKWDPQLLIELDLDLPLKDSVNIIDNLGNTVLVQKVVYRNLPNACFHCLKQGHLIRDCPDIKTTPDTGKDKEESFQPVNKKHVALNLVNKPKNPPKQNRNLNRFAALLEDVMDPTNKVNNIFSDYFPHVSSAKAGHRSGQGASGNDPTAAPDSSSTPKGRVGSSDNDADQVLGTPTGKTFADIPDKGKGGSSDNESFPDQGSPKGNEFVSANKRFNEFDSEIEKSDNEYMASIDFSPAKSVEIVMTQAEEEALPSEIWSTKSKRKKEKNLDPNRASVHYAKPLKTVKK